MADQGGGRARGRARGRAGAATASTTGDWSTTGSDSTAQRRATSWDSSAETMGLATTAATATSCPATPPQPAPKSTGRAAQRVGVREGAPGDAGLAAHMRDLRVGAGDNGNGNGAAGQGRGTMRGRRTIQFDNIRTRPEHVNSKLGTSGQSVKLSANYFEVLHHTDWCLYQYRVDFAPEEDRTGLRKAMLRDHKKVIGGYIFDGTMMFTSHRLNPDPMELFSTRQSDEAQIRITIKLVGDLSQGDSHYLQFFNIIMRKCLGHLKLQLVGRNFFDARAKVDIREFKLELWPGYITSIRQHEMKIMMCAEITHKVMRQDNVLDLLSECHRQSSNDPRNTFVKAIVGSVVLTDYNNRTYRIDDVDWDVTPASTFPLKEGATISYKDYYSQKYQINITQPKQPMLVSRSKPRELRAGMSELIYLVPELCRMTGLTDEMRANFHLMRALAEHTRVGPDIRIQKLNNFCNRLLGEQAVRQDLEEWNLQLSNRLVEFNGRILPQEKILQAQDIKYDAGADTDWTRNLRSNPLLIIPQLQFWVVIVPNRASRDAGGFIQTLIKAAGGMRFIMPKPQVVEIPDDRAGTYVNALENVISGKNPQLIMCIVSNNRIDRYSAIKKKCCVDRAVPTQVMLAKNLASKGVMSIATKVAIQINCKTGGAPWTVDVPLTNLMIVGFDVCHDTTDKGKSYGAMVASLNKSLSRYFSAVSAHTSGEELSSHLAANMTKALRKYQDHNQGSLPGRIVFYRDGVGEGQIPYVFLTEVKLLKEQLDKIYGGTPVKMAFIIVTKRINTRIFLKGGNPPPGTVVDDCITIPDRYDFYLVSQSVRQGTVSPTSYNVISDNIGLDPDKLQRLTYKLTHLYYNWSGTVRVPAPCQYAHKLAFLVGQALHRSPNVQLDDYLYFL